MRRSMLVIILALAVATSAQAGQPPGRVTITPMGPVTALLDRGRAWVRFAVARREFERWVAKDPALKKFYDTNVLAKYARRFNRLGVEDAAVAAGGTVTALVSPLFALGFVSMSVGASELSFVRAKSFRQRAATETLKEAVRQGRPMPDEKIREWSAAGLFGSPSPRTN